MCDKKSNCLIKIVNILSSSLLIVIAAAIIVRTLHSATKLLMVKEYLDFTDSKPQIFLLTGCVLLITTGFLGIIAVLQSWRGGLITYLGFSVYLLISLVVLSVTFYILSEPMHETIHTQLTTHMSNYTYYHQSVDKLQFMLSCCGINDYTYWNDSIPGSCCQSIVACSSAAMSARHDVPGCYEALVGILDHIYHRFPLFIGLLAAAMSLSIVLSAFLIRSFGRRQFHIAKKNDESGNEERISLPRVDTPPKVSVSPSAPVLDTPGSPVTPPFTYIRRPSLRPVELTYANPHEAFIRGPPQQRYDHRALGNSPKVKLTYA